MRPPRDPDLARISAESQAHILRSKADCKEGADHVRASHEAVQRSLRLLRHRI